MNSAAHRTATVVLTPKSDRRTDLLRHQPKVRGAVATDAFAPTRWVKRCARLLLLAALATAVSTALLAPAARANAGKGVTVHCYYVNDSNRMEVFKAMADAGARWVRLDLDWRSGEPVQGAWNMSYLGQVDTCVNAARAAGLNVLMVVGATPPWAMRDLSARWQDGPRKAQYYASALAFLAGHFKGRISAWEVWNEQNARMFWTNTAAHYVEMLKATYPAIKKADPQALVISGGTAHSDLGWFEQAYALGIKGSFDALGVHPYEASGASSTALSGFRRLGAIHELMLSYGDKRPIWLTEFSWLHGADTNDAQQATYLRRSVSCLPFMPYIKMALWYQSYSANRDIDAEYAMLGPGLQPRAAFHAFKQWQPGKTMLSPTTAARLCRPRLSAASPVVLRR